MSTVTLDVPQAVFTPGRPDHRPVAFSRLVRVELRKMFDTRSGFWLMIGIALAAVAASTSVILFAEDSAITQENFSAAIGFPIAILLPVIALLSVTGEYSQRTGLMTYAFVPRRGRVLRAKVAALIGVGVVSMLVALGVGALGTLLGSAIRGVDPVWDTSPTQFALICLANVLGMLLGFMFGVVCRNSPGAIVAYFVYAFAWPTLAGLLAYSQGWFADLQPWVDANQSIAMLFDVTPTGRGWAQLATSTALFLWIPLAIGWQRLVRVEVK